MSISITLNGKTISTPDSSTIHDLLTSLEINPLHVVVEVNGTIIQREQFGSTAIKKDDLVEILRFVGGGSHG